MIRLSLVTALLGLGMACMPAHGHRKETLVPAPRLAAHEDLLGDVPASEQAPDVSLIYLTDRMPLKPDDPPRAYGYVRSMQPRWGTADVALGKGRSWDELAERTATAGRREAWPVTVEAVDERGIWPDFRDLVRMGPDGVLLDRDAVDAAWAAVVPFQEAVREQLEATESGDVYVTIHGFAAGFGDSLFAPAQLHHHLGRRGATIAYSWPAGKNGFIPTAYQYDRESGEFTVLNLKVLLWVLADIEEVERVHLVAHSRGTAVTVDALRELYLRYEDEVPPIRERLKLDTVVLASPDIDLDVFGRRVTAEQVFNVTRRFVVYVSPKDGAIGASAWMQGGAARVGRLNADMVTEATAAAIKDQDILQVVAVRANTRGDTHAYYLSQPAVFSDLLRVLRDHVEPGTPERPLPQDRSGFWILDDDYLEPD